MKFQLYLDSANSIAPGGDNAVTQFALNQGIVGASRCSVLNLNFINSIANTAICFNSTNLTPSDKRFVACTQTQPIQMPFLTYVLSDPGGAIYETNNSLPTPLTVFELSGQAFNYIDVTITDAATGLTVTGMTRWNMVLEFELAPFVPYMHQPSSYLNVLRER